MLSRKVGQPLEQLSTWLKPHTQGGLIMTQGAAGATIIIGGQRRSQAAVAVSTPVDPTGCGDAFRAGLLYALSKGHSLEKAVSHGIVLGAIKVQSRGGQNHTVSETMVADMLSKLL
jgi:adenosine kinase